MRLAFYGLLLNTIKPLEIDKELTYEEYIAQNNREVYNPFKSESLVLLSFIITFEFE
jgi:hypothetical protein